MTSSRNIAAIALAAGTFGGTVGALATAAVQSQASPHATAAAAQTISDPYAERLLQQIDSFAYAAAANDHQICLNTKHGITEVCPPVRP